MENNLEFVVRAIFKFSSLCAPSMFLRVLFFLSSRHDDTDVEENEAVGLEEYEKRGVDGEDIVWQEDRDFRDRLVMEK